MASLGKMFENYEKCPISKKSRNLQCCILDGTRLEKSQRCLILCVLYQYPGNFSYVTDSNVLSPVSQINQPTTVEPTENPPLTNSPQNQNIDASSNKIITSAMETNHSVNGNGSNGVEPSDEDIIREQQRKIEELQRQLLNSQLLLQQQRQQQQLQQQARASQTFQVGLKTLANIFSLLEHRV